MPKVRKVLMMVENLTVPADPRVWSEATTLREAGYQVTVISPKGATKYQESYSYIDNIHIYRYKLPVIRHAYFAHIIEYSAALFMTFLLSFKVLFRHGFDVIHAANPPDMFFLIGLFYKVFGKKFVYDQHDLTPELFQVIFQYRMKPLYWLLRLMERWSYRSAHLIITTNTSFKRLAVERGYCPAKKIVVVRNGPDLKLYESVSEKTELPLPAQRRYSLAYMGVMGKQDGVEYVLYALHHLIYKRGRQDVSAVLIGEGDVTHELRALAHELNLDEYVFFTGWLEKSEALSYLAAAHVGLVPDPMNGLNEFCTMIKTMEYMAIGLPIVAFDLAETRFSAHNAALYAKPNEVEDFADTIEILLENEALRRSMGADGQKRVAGVLNWEHSREHLLAAYEVFFPDAIVMQPEEDLVDSPADYVATASRLKGS